MSKHLISIYGYFGFANTGDEAILHCMLEQLRILQGRLPHLDVVIFSADPDYTRKVHQITAVPSVLPPTYFDFFYRFIRGDRAGYRLALKTFYHTKVFLVGGGGLFFDNPDSNLFLGRLLSKIRWAKKLGHRVAVLGVGVGPIYLEASRRILRETLSSVDLITVRDDVSRRMLDEIGVNGPPIHTSSDFVYLLEPAAEDRVDEIIRAEGLRMSEKPRVAICLFGDQVKNDLNKKCFVQFCQYVTKELDAEVWFVPMQTGGGFDDRLGARAIYEQLPDKNGVYLIEGIYTPWETMGLMKRTDAVLCVRLHGVILAINNHTPVFGISYMPKVERVFREIGHLEWQLTPDQLSCERLVAGFSAVWFRRSAIGVELSTLSSEFRRRSLTNCSILGEKLTQWELSGRSVER